jgi:formate dehydrogenase (coenzyme F420) beta subunit
VPEHAILSVTDNDLCGAFAGLVTSLLADGDVEAVLIPARQPIGNCVMPTLITSPESAAVVDPLAPVAASSSATLLARLTRKGSGHRVAAFLRPCEVRAFIELVKLKQASLDDVILVGMDCYGRYDTRDFRDYVGSEECASLEFQKAIRQGLGTEVTDGIDIVDTCKACVTPVADQVDIRLQVIGYRVEEGLGLEAVTPAGKAVLEKLGLPAGDEPAEREEAIAALTAEREAKRQSLRTEYKDKAKDIEGLMGIISSCVNCYNCRVACPVCYCRECVFVTDTFGHEGQQYMNWAKKRGGLRMPTDTMFYHLTRMAHMSTLCVGCGQCSSACPHDIPVAELFSMVGEEAQSVFDYVPGRSVEEVQPLTYFVEAELAEVTGQVK